ncbi:MAG TPA: rhomboid family intramembrane serine protease [Dermatophilaceae bacterium]|nr:rhomboid family intramembrane serine protease [Dermatophilaceae bacterium]
MTEYFAPSAPQQAEPTCPRHPDRVSYVRCQRCGRPVCPECQRPAAVGVQCVDCVAQAARASRPTRTQLGARTTAGQPMVTWTIVGICVAVWLLQQVSGRVTAEFAFLPAYAESAPWRFLTAAFLHGPIYHLLFNMYALWIVGQYLEPLLGRVRFAALYLLSALGGSVGSLLLAAPVLERGALWFTPSVGASGAVFGLFAALLVLNRHLGRSSAGIATVIVINGVIGFVVPGIAWQAHLGGAVTGAALAAVLAWAAPKQRRRLQLPLLGAVALVVVALAVVKLSTVPAQLLF